MFSNGEAFLSPSISPNSRSLHFFQYSFARKLFCLRVRMAHFSSSNAYNVLSVFVKFFVLMGSFCLGAGPSCYDRSGKLISNHRPCDPSAVQSSCCDVGWACLGNFLCKSTDQADVGTGSIALSSCTDVNWPTAVCPNLCEKGEKAPPLRKEAPSEIVI